MRSIVILLMLVLAACTAENAPPSLASTAAPPAATPTAEPPAPDSPPPVPDAACRPEGRWAFLEHFARSPAVRARLAAPQAAAELARFDVALVDHRWQRASRPDMALDMREVEAPGGFVVDATPVEFGEDDEVARTLGNPTRYAFEHVDGCWRFAGIR